MFHINFMVFVDDKDPHEKSYNALYFILTSRAQCANQQYRAHLRTLCEVL